MLACAAQRSTTFWPIRPIRSSGVMEQQTAYAYGEGGRPAFVVGAPWFGHSAHERDPSRYHVRRGRRVMLNLDLMRLENGERFHKLCSRLVKRAFPGAVAFNVASWDGGRDIVTMGRLENGQIVHDIVWQAKFTSRLDATTKKSIAESIETLAALDIVVPKRWILCLPVDPTGKFHDWLLGAVPHDWNPEIWGRDALMERLEANPDIVETFFAADF